MIANSITFGNYMCTFSGLFSDFDGTLSEIEKNPQDVSIYKDCQTALTNLSKYFITGIISGRPVANVKDIAGIKDIYYIGNHGAEIIKPCVTVTPHQHNIQNPEERGDCHQSNFEEIFVFPQAKKAAPYIDDIYKTVKNNLDPALEFDFKKYSASIHYRNHPQPREAKKKIYDLLKNYLSSDLLEINDGRMVVEIRIKGINKATALKKIIEDEDLRNFIYFGDDSTDIDIFKIDNPEHLNVVVKNPEARPDIYKYADVLLDGPKEVAAMLQDLLDTWKHRSQESRVKSQE